MTDIFAAPPTSSPPSVRLATIQVSTEKKEILPRVDTGARARRKQEPAGSDYL